MNHEIRRQRNGVQFDGAKLDIFANEKGLWYEDPDTVAEGLAWGREKARLLRWIRGVMERKLSPKEREAIEAYFFSGQTYREAGENMSRNASSVHRAVRRAMHKLREAAAEEGQIQRPMRRRRRQRGC